MKTNKLLLALMLTIAISFAMVENSIANEDKDSPIMIIRFNQEYVNYENQLEKIVESAIDIKPSTFFDIVSVIPDTGNKRRNKKQKQNANILASEVAHNIQLSGIQKENIRTTYQNSPDVKNNEVHIFVR